MIKTIRGFMKRLNEDHVGAYAAQSAYFILLSFIPFVLLVVTLVKYTPLTRDDVYSVLINMLPTEFQSYVGGIVNEIFISPLLICRLRSSQRCGRRERALRR